MKRDLVQLSKIAGLTRQFPISIYIHRRINNPGFSQRMEKVVEKIGLTRLLGSTVVIKAVRCAISQ